MVASVKIRPIVSCSMTGLRGCSPKCACCFHYTKLGIIMLHRCLFALTLVVLGIMAVPPSVNAAQEKKKNILFILADDMRRDTIAAMGNSHIVTPNLDKLAKGGTFFTRA